MINFKSSNGILTIDLKALTNNYNLFKGKINTNNCAVAGVVKANAYGLGLKQISGALMAQNCPQFFVATLDEALELREYDSKTPIAVLGGLLHGAEQDYIKKYITPVLNTPDDIGRWNNLAINQNTRLSAILHFDTGMNRLGLSHEEITHFIEHQNDFKALHIKTLMSHFACADDRDHPLTQAQAKQFYEISQHFPNAQKSLCNSPGLFRDASYHYDMVRPGYSLYGGNPTPETTNPMQAVVSLNTRILQIRDCKKGQSIGYGATHTFDQDTTTATVALGYADGFLRSNSSKATLYYNNQPCPVLGRVSMDLVTIDISNIKGEPPKQNDAIEILGPNQTIDDLATSAGTIGYEILTSLGARYKREYI